MKIGIIRKGLILVAVPLTFGIGYFSLLFFAVLEANRMVDREIVLKDAIICHIEALRCNCAASLGKLAFLLSKDPLYQNLFTQNQDDAFEADKHLRKLLENEKTVTIPGLLESYAQIFPKGELADSSVLTMSTLLKQLQKMSDDQALQVVQAIQSLQDLLTGGMIAGVAISAALAVYLCRTQQHGKIRVGLIVITVPLVFQLCFAFAIGNMLARIDEQTKKEKRSKEVLEVLNRSADRVMGSFGPAVMHVYLQSDKFRKIMLHFNSASSLLEQAKVLCADDPAQLKNIEKSEVLVRKLASVMTNTEIIQTSREGFEALDPEIHKVFEDALSARTGPSKANESSFNKTPQPKSTLMELGRLQGKMSPTEMFSQLKLLITDPVHEAAKESLVKLLNEQNPMLELERLKGEKLSKKRQEMTTNLKYTLLGGIAGSLALSSLLAAFLVSMSNRQS